MDHGCRYGGCSNLRRQRSQDALVFFEQAVRVLVVFHQFLEFAEILLLHRIQVTRGKASAERSDRLVNTGVFDRDERVQRPQAGDGGTDLQ